MTRLRVCAIVGLVAFACFAQMAPAGPYWLDSQELASAGVRWGVPHPTGFPMWCLLVRIATFLPFGELAYRIHLVSALFAALALALLVDLVVDALGHSRVAHVVAVFAAVLCAASTTFLRQATVTEVYAPTVFAIALALWLVRRKPSTLSLIFLSGLAFTGLHASYRWILGSPILMLCAWRLRRGQRGALAAPTLLALGALGMLAYLPLRSASGQVALLDWGHPRTASSLWAHASASRIRAAYGEVIMSRVPETVIWNARGFAAEVEGDFGAIALVFASIGVLGGLATKRTRSFTLWMVLLVGADFVYAAWVNPMGTRDRQNGVPLALGVAALAALGIWVAAQRFGRAGPFAAGVFGLLAAAPAMLGAIPTARGDAPRRWSEAALEQCPPGAIALVQGDSTAAGLFWLTQVEGERPDVAVLVRQHLWDGERTRAALSRSGVKSAPEALLSAVSGGHSVLWEPGIDRAPRRLAPDAPLASFAESAVLDVTLARLVRIFGDASELDENGRHVYASALTSLGLAVMDREQTAALFESALRVDPSHATALVNIGALLARAGKVAEAAKTTEAALALRANDATALVNAARYRLDLGQDDVAERHAARATRVEAKRAEAWSLLGVIEARRGRHEEARVNFRRALALDPEDHDAKVNLAKLAEPGE